MQRFVELFTEGPFKKLDMLFDAKLRTEDGMTYPVHRIQLALRNIYFKSLFCGSFDNSNDVLVKGIEGDVLGHVLYYLYTNEIVLDRRIVMEVLIASDYFLVDSLKDICKTFVLRELDVDCVLGVFLIVWNIDGLGLKEECFRFLVVHFNEVVLDCLSPCRENSAERTGLDILRDLPFEALQKVLDNRSLNVISERMVWQVIVAWFGLNYQIKQQFVPDILRCMYIEDMAEELLAEIQQNPLVAHHNILNKEPQSSNTLIENFTHGSRSPTDLYFVAQYSLYGNSFFLNLYLTFDQKLDVWRQLTTNLALCPDFIVQIGFNIYMFDSWENRCIAFNMIDCTRNEIPPFRTHRSRYLVVSVMDKIYIFGGATPEFEDTETIECFDPATNEWTTIPPMVFPMILTEAVAVNDCIYAIGDFGGEINPDMMVQVYNPISNAWHIVSGPRDFRHEFTSAVYRGRLFVVGGENNESFLKTVEEYCPEKDAWRSLPDLPFVYVLPKAIVLQDLLIVYENHLENRRLGSTSPPVYWDSGNENWVVIDESSPFFHVHMYQFCNISQPQVVKDLVGKNRRYDGEWIKCDFA